MERQNAVAVPSEAVILNYDNIFTILVFIIFFNQINATLVKRLPSKS